jgi:putative flippase GtrA
MPDEAPGPSIFAKIRKVLINREVMTYLVFGVLTTAINLAVYFGIRSYMDWTIANAIAWIVAVEFAFLTNRRIVFRSRGNHLREMLQFYLSRLVTLGMEYAALFTMNVWIGMDDRISKLVAGVFVVIGNYLLSKWIVFSRRAAPPPPSEAG